MKRVVTTSPGKKVSSNIVFDNDVVVTDNANIGKTLDAVLSAQEARIAAIESNTKWLYKYGGMGSGGGGGGGGGEQATFKVVLTDVKSSRILQSSGSGTNKLDYGTSGNFAFNIKIYKGGGASFKVSWKWQKDGVDIHDDTRIYQTDDYQKTITVNFTSNTDFSLTVENADDPDSIPVVYTAQVVTNSYKFSTHYVTYDPDLRKIVDYKPTNGNIFMREVQENGLSVAFECEVNSQLVQASYSYKDWISDQYVEKKCPHVNDKEIYDDEIQSNMAKTIYLGLVPPSYEGGITRYLSNYNNASTKYFFLNVNMKIDGKQEFEKIETLVLNDILIPPDMYLKVDPVEGMIHDIKQDQISCYVYDGGAKTWVSKPEAEVPHPIDVVAHNSYTYSLAAPEGTVIHEGSHFYKVQNQEWVEIEETHAAGAVDSVNHGNNFYSVSVADGVGIRQHEDKYDGSFIAGSSISFRLVPYFGSLQNPKRTFSFQMFIDGWKVDPTKISNITSLLEQEVTKVTPLITNDGRTWHELTFKIQQGTQHYEKSYYIGVKELQSFDWFKEEPVGDCYFRQGFGASGIKNRNTGKYLQAGDAVDMTVNTQDIVFEFVDNREKMVNDNDYDQFFSIGFQYSAINTASQPVFTLNTYNDAQCIRVYQDKIEILNGGTRQNSIDFAINKEFASDKGDSNKFHLVSIYTHLESQPTGFQHNSMRSVRAYVDGVLDAAFTQFISHFRFDSVTLHSGNYFVNLLECACIKHTHTDASAFGQIGPTQFFYAYDEKILKHAYPDDQRDLYEEKMQVFGAFSNATTDEDNFVCFSDDSSIKTIAWNTDANVMVFNFDDQTGAGVGAFTGKGRDNLKLWMSQSYAQDDPNADILVPVTLQWSEDKKNGLKSIKNAGGNDIIFNIQLQGSSTLNYRCKNWELSLPENKDPSGLQMVYSPNFRAPTAGSTDQTYGNTFLPERSFTLKADVVDSSHSNNNTMGSFINEVMTPFSGATAQAGEMEPYIKTCLTGFPIMVFLHTVWLDDAGSVQNKYYFLGVYNFNIGRKSYFNLGYADTSIFALSESSKQPDQILLKNGFNTYEVQVADYNIKRGLRVAEVQDNAMKDGTECFDFSQSNSSILFPLDDLANDKDAMFGDLVDGSEEQSIKTDVRKFVDGVALAGGYIFEELEKNFSEDASDKFGYLSAYAQVDEAEQVSLNRVPNYKHVLSAYVEDSQKKVVPTTQTRNKVDFSYLQTFLDGDDSDPDAKVEKAIDYTSVSEYYTICMAFGLVDSVAKNLNIKSWNGGKTFYTAFYDMDTCLGINNKGKKVKYFAFSDYWKSNYKNGILDTTRVQYDFSPKNLKGIDTGSLYDTPSSYLFALAKYAYSIYSGQEGVSTTTVDNSPNSLWALWRRGTPHRDATAKGSRGEGCLCNSNYFIETYYKSHLEVIPAPALNLNYCYKYLVYQSNKEAIDKERRAFDDVNFGMFGGRRIAYIKDWLNSRFHILDAYFNLTMIVDYINSQAAHKYAIPIPKYAIDSSNADIYVRKEIFSSGDVGNSYTSDINVRVKAMPFSPIVPSVNATALGRYITPDSSEENINLTLKVSGSQNAKIGGSSLFTDIASIDPFITANKSLTLNSSFLSQIKGNPSVDEGKPCSNGWNINCPSVNTVSLKCKNYSGALRFDETCKNLQVIDISNTGIQLTATSVPLSSFSATNMQEQSEIHIQSVPTLEEVHLNGKCRYIYMPSWGRNGVCNMTLPTEGEYLSCSTIELHNERFEDAKVTVKNNPSLTQLTLESFTDVTITNCPKLTSIIFADQSDIKALKKISISFNNDTENTVFKIGTAADADVDFSTFDNLSSVAFSNVSINRVKFSPKSTIHLGTNAFYRCKNLIELVPGDNGTEKTTFSIDGSGVFQYCGNFRLNQIRTKDCLTFSPNIKSLASMFNVYYGNGTVDQGSITNEDALYFLQKCYDTKYAKPAEEGKDPEYDYVKDHIESVESMFAYQKKLTYSSQEMLNDYRVDPDDPDDKPTCRFKLDFPNATNAKSAFYDTGIHSFNKYMLETFGKNKTSIEIDNIITGQPIYATRDFLYFVIDKLAKFGPYLWTSNASYSQSYLTFIDETKDTVQTLGQIALKDVFIVRDLQGILSEIKHPSKITELTNISITNVVDVEGLFDDKDAWKAGYENGFAIDFFGTGRNLQVLVYDKKVDDETVTINPFESFLRDAKVTSIKRSFRNVKFVKLVQDGDDQYYDDVSNEIYVDIGSFINWDSLDAITNLYYDYYIESLQFNKKISYNVTKMEGSKVLAYSFNDVWDKIAANSTITHMSYIFRNAKIIYGDNTTSSRYKDGDPFFLNSKEFMHADEIVTNSTLATVSYMFDGMRMKLSLDEPDTAVHYLSFTSDFFKCFTGIKNAYKAFRNLYLMNTLPYDFFNKRNATPDVLFPIYVEKEVGSTELIPAKLYSFSYRQELEDISYCFENAIFKANVAFDPAAAYNKRFAEGEDKFFVRDSYFTVTIPDPDDPSQEIEVEVERDKYYDTSDPTSQQHPFVHATEVTDCNVQTKYDETFSIQYNGSAVVMENFHLAGPTGDSSQFMNKVLVAPDILYGIGTSYNVDGLFANTIDTETTISIDSGYASKSTQGGTVNNLTFTGALPKNLLKANSSMRFKNAFLRVNVLPQLFGQYIEKVESGATTRDVLHSCYAFVPSQFSARSDLASAFTFRVFMPAPGNSTSVTDFYILLQDSIRKEVAVLNGAMPTRACLHLYTSDDRVKEKTVDYEFYKYGNTLSYHLIGKPTFDVDGNMIGMNEGFDFKDHFTAAYFNGLVSTRLVRLLSGYIFKPGSFAEEIEERANGTIITIGNGGYVNKGLKFPLTSPYLLKYVVAPDSGQGVRRTFNTKSIENYSNFSADEINTFKTKGIYFDSTP